MKYSIIIPVFNVEKYIRKCIESVIQQTFSDYEVIVVDDGTPDHSMDIVEEYVDTGKLKIVHQSNSGIAKARFAGIDAASGEYLLFLDSDDFVSQKLLEIVDKNIGIADILEYSSFSFIDGEEDAVLDNGEQGNVECILKREEFRKQIALGDIARGERSCLMWNKVYRRDFVNKYVTDITLNMTLEDFTFNCQYYCSVNQYIKISNKLYFYRDRPGSITKRIDPNIQAILNSASKIQKTSLYKMNLLDDSTRIDISAWYMRYLMNALQIGFQTNTFDEDEIVHILGSQEVIDRCQLVADGENDTRLYQLVRYRKYKAIIRRLKLTGFRKDVYRKLSQIEMLRTIKSFLLMRHRG